MAEPCAWLAVDLPSPPSTPPWERLAAAAVSVSDTGPLAALLCRDEQPLPDAHRVQFKPQLLVGEPEQDVQTRGRWQLHVVAPGQKERHEEPLL